MRFDLDETERDLQRGIRELCEGRFPMERVRAGFEAKGWRELADAGVFSLRLDDGAGLGMTEAVLVFEELGRALVPGPLVASNLAAGHVDGVAEGERVATIVHDGVVEHLDVADVALVVDEDRVVVADSVGAEPVARPLDPLTPVHRIDGTLRGRTVDVDFRLEGAALTAALCVGIASRTTEVATAYAKEREQFGRPIGSFQAIKHICADMLVRAEVARASVHAAGCVLDDPGVGDALRAVAGAKVVAAEAAIRNAKANIQVHGGMGFTWEVDAHLYLKRAAVLATHFGSTDAHAEVVAKCL